MTTTQRRKSDMATMDKRETVDKALNISRDRNDALTQERRFEADKTIDANRARNDEITADRRAVKDGNRDMVLAISFLTLIVLTVTALIIFA